MSDEGKGNGGRWGAWLNGPARTILPAVIIVGAGGYAIYRNKPLSSRDVVPPPTKASGGNDGGGGGEAPVTSEMQAGEKGPVENIVEFLSDPNVYIPGAAVVISIATAFLARWAMSGRKQTA